MKYEKGEDVEFILKTLKDSDTGIFTNERLLLIKSGIICYFSQIPKKFMGSARAIELSGQLPKYAVPADQIDDIFLNGGVLSLLFKKSKLISRQMFSELIKKDPASLQKTSEKSVAKESGFVKWVFNCQNIELMEEFHRLANLFRTGNPKFIPNLTELIAGYQPKKKGRQMSMAPTAHSTLQSGNLRKNRMSEMPNLKRDSFLDSLGFTDLPRKPTPIIVPVSVQHVVQETAHNNNNTLIASPSVNNKQKERLSFVVSRLSSTNHPGLGVIQEGENEDKLSDISKGTKEQIVFKEIQKQIQKEKFSQSKYTNRLSSIQQIKFDLDNPSSMQLITSTSEMSFASQPFIVASSPPKNQTKTAKIDKIQYKVAPPLQTKAESSAKVQNSQSKTDKISPQKKSKQQKSKDTVALNKKLSLMKNEAIEAKYRSKSRINSETSLSNNLSASHIEPSGSISHQTRMIQLIKAANWANNFNTDKVCTQLDLTHQQLQFILRNHTSQEDSWSQYIQNQLSIITAQELSDKEEEKSPKFNWIFKINQNTIDKYHVLSKQTTKNEGESQDSIMSQFYGFERYEDAKQEQSLVLQWAIDHISSSAPKTKFTLVVEDSQFNFNLKYVSFEQNNVRSLKLGWLVQKSGFLQQFLAYLRLQRVLKDISKQIRGDVNLVCAQIMYLRYKQYEGVVSRWGTSNYSQPLKANKSLDYLSNSNYIKLFQQQFPQFALLAEQVKSQPLTYCIHLQRISQEFNTQTAQRQLNKLISPFQNELDIFYDSPEYISIEQNCLNLLQKIQKERKNITDEALYEVLQSMSSNIAVDTLCKILGCRLSKNGNIYYYPRMLKLGVRQFGQEMNLIKRAIKKQNIEVGRQITKKLMGRLQFYSAVTPISNFIQVYLQLADVSFVEKNDLKRAVPVLLQVLQLLSESQIEQYSVYVSLMKVYLKLGQYPNFVRAFQNCRLFLSNMFKQITSLFDLRFEKIVVIILAQNDPQKALYQLAKLNISISQDQKLAESVKKQFISQLQWLKNKILLLSNKSQAAYDSCLEYLTQTEKSLINLNDSRIDGLLCLCQCWLKLQHITLVSSVDIQKRIEKALQNSFTSNNVQYVFLLVMMGIKVLQKCQENSMPSALASSRIFSRARQQWDQLKKQLRTSRDQE